MADRLWFVIAAAGAATRFGGRLPKTYVRIAGRTLLEHAIAGLSGLKGLAGGVVVLAAHDRRFARLPRRVRRGLVVARGGASRADSVLAGLRALRQARARDWVLVHDAARPCLPRADLERLLRACRGQRVGGLLALPVADTVKVDDGRGRVARTLPRERLWRAQTPQLFRHGLLVRALAAARAAGVDPTDESAAVERLGLKPLLVEGSPLNVKVTRPSDLAVVRAALARRGRTG